MKRRMMTALPLLAVASLLSCGRPSERAAPDLQSVVPGDVCQQCAGMLMSAFVEVIGLPRPTIDDVGRFVHIEDDFTIAARELSEPDYFDYIHSGHDTTASMYAQRIKAILDQSADITRWNATMAGPVCEVEIKEAGLALTITNRPRCYVTIIRHEGSPLLE